MCEIFPLNCTDTNVTTANSKTSLSPSPFKSGRQNGQAVILVVVASSLFMFATLGLGLDGGQLFAHSRMAQAAADAATQAAIMSMLRGTNSTSTHPFSTAASFTCTVPPAALDLRTPCVYAQYNGFGTSADTVTVSFPATITGVTLSSVTAPAVTVSVQRVLHTTFMRFVGISSVIVTAKGSAGLFSTVPPQCIFVLDPSAQNAFTANNGASVSMNCGIAVDSNNSDAATIVGGATVTASAISIVGGDVINNGGSASPAPTTGSSAVSDPFASVTEPTAGACAHTGYDSGPGTFTLLPGTYCSGLIVDNSANVTFSPGQYIINGGTLHFAGGTNVTGSNVSFYLTGTNASYGSVIIDNGVTATLSAPTSGADAGLLFFEDRTITSSTAATFAGGATMQLTGSIYFPTTGISFSNGTSASITAALVGKQVSFTGGTDLKFDPTGTKTGLAINRAALVQ